jgi:CheY-like chemotaxis protein
VQCVANLLTNAAKYTDVGGKIGVELREEAGIAIIAVTDSGVGIPPDLLPKVFDLFVQSERSLDRSQGGLGIGLSVVRRLIEMHDGSVRASSEGLGHGARFELRLPTIPAPHVLDPASPERQLAAKRILVVDDNVDAADSLAMVLNQRGHNAEAVFSPSAAIERAATLNPEIVLLDIGLPGMDGYEVAQRIRAAGGAARLVALTGYGQPEDVRRARAAGFDAHLVKPVDLENLMRSIAEPP